VDEQRKKDLRMKSNQYRKVIQRGLLLTRRRHPRFNQEELRTCQNI